MILVDTSIWIDHLRHSDPVLVDALEAGRVFMHPFVIGEIACGCLANRAEVLEILCELPASPTATESPAWLPVQPFLPRAPRRVGRSKYPK